MAVDSSCFSYRALLKWVDMLLGGQKTCRDCRGHGQSCHSVHRSMVTSMFGGVQQCCALPVKTALNVARASSSGCTWKMDLAASAGLGSSAFGPGACVTAAVSLLAPPKRYAAPVLTCAGHAPQANMPLLLKLEPQAAPLLQCCKHPSEGGRT